MQRPYVRYRPDRGPEHVKQWRNFRASPMIWRGCGQRGKRSTFTLRKKSSVLVKTGAGFHRSSRKSYWPCTLTPSVIGRCRTRNGLLSERPCCVNHPAIHEALGLKAASCGGLIESCWKQFASGSMQDIADRLQAFGGR